MCTNVCTLECTYSSPVCLFARDEFHFTCVISPDSRVFQNRLGVSNIIVLPFQLYEIRDAKKFTTFPSIEHTFHTCFLF